jgi:STE24 endopeptidase
MPSDARRYARIRYRLLLIELVGWLAFLWAYQGLGLSAMAAGWVRGMFPGASLQIAAYLLLFGLAYELVFFPLHWYGGFRLEHRFGLSRMTLSGWLWREAKRLLVSAILGLMLIEGLYVLLQNAPTRWPIYATIGWAGFSILLARVFPTWLLPIFYTTSRLDDEALGQRLLTLCERARLSALGVFRINLGVETRKANAALAGLGRTRRVLLSDTLLEQFTPEEIETVLAHELGHHRHHHLTKLLVISGLGSWIAFSIVDGVARRWLEPLGVPALADITGFPVLMLLLSLIGLIGLPLQNGLSRSFEAQADLFAVAVTSLPGAFASALRRLAELNLADPRPPRWVELLFYDHPPITKRIRAAEASS